MEGGALGREAVTECSEGPRSTVNNIDELGENIVYVSTTVLIVCRAAGGT